jgi:hypothetical protein
MERSIKTKNSVEKLASICSAKDPIEEFKEKIFFGLRKASEIHLVKKYISFSNRLFPYFFPFSYEGDEKESSFT